MPSSVRRRGIIICALLILAYITLDRISFVKIHSLLSILLGLGILATTVIQMGYIAQWITRARLETFRRISLGIAASYIVLPTLLYAIYKVTGAIHSIDPLLLCAGVLIVSALTEHYENTSKSEQSRKDIPIFWYCAAVFIIIITSLILSYKPLPDLDPYGWIQTLQPQFKQHVLPPLTERPLFASFVYICIQLLHVDMFTFFKYIFPFLLLTILPILWVLAEKIQKASHKVLFMLYVLAIPSTALYATTQTPQAVLIVTSIYAIGFLLLSAIERNSRYFFIAGILLGASFLYHQAAAIAFLVWLLGCTIAYRKKLFGHWKNIVIGVLTVLVFRAQIQTLGIFVWYWVYAISVKLFAPDNLNMLYPAQYINIDHNEMGWPGISGIIKFYGYYMSPIVGLVLLASLLIVFSKNKTRLFSFLRIKEYSIIIAALGVFLSIAEVLPRFPNIALLPERSWVFISIFTIPLLFFIARIRHKRIQERVFLALAYLSLIIGISGTLYVNSLKRFLINPDQLASAEWIKANLPANKIIYGYGNGNLIIFHAKSPYRDFNKNILCSKIPLEEVYGQLTGTGENRKLIRETINTSVDIQNATRAFIIDAEREYATKNPSSLAIIKNPMLQHVKELIQRFPSQEAASGDPLAKEKGIPTSTLDKPAAISQNSSEFIYFAPKDKKNPYNDRGYHPEHWGTSECKNGEFIFDIYPKDFQRIYEHNGIVIWKIIGQHDS